MHTDCFNGHFPGNPGFASANCPHDSQPPVILILSILEGPAKNSSHPAFKVDRRGCPQVFQSTAHPLILTTIQGGLKQCHTTSVGVILVSCLRFLNYLHIDDCRHLFIMSVFVL